ncbi:TetR/AcrR family transcriptional regulator [Bradyrhizobium sp. USDA 4486]
MKKTKRGRPPKDLAGDAQARILDAAQQLFLEKGFRSASIDDISELAPEQADDPCPFPWQGSAVRRGGGPAPSTA